MKKIYLMLLAGLALVSCNCRKPNYASVDEYPVKKTSVQEVNYSSSETTFTLWSPNADSVLVSIYATQSEPEPVVRRPMTRRVDGAWETSVIGDWKGYFYTFLVRQSNTKWELKETPGIFAVAVGANGHRGAIVEMSETNPEGWAEDKRPELNRAADAIVYEMHHRDFSIHPSSGISHRGKFIALTEEGTMTKDGQPTGIDHLKQLGVTHVQILPSYDYGSVDETQLALNKYNWGYDPVNYNVPDGSYSTDPYDPVCRIKEFKQMVQSLHAAGIRVILDVVYNHTFDVGNSNFTLTCPDYFYRTREDGSLGNASGCGNETASERPMMRKFMLESLRWWAEEYHLDGFRFDLMAIHDIETMRQIRKMLDEIDPSIIIYGEGWAAETPLTDESIRPMKANVPRLKGIGAFSDELRDGLRGSCFNDKDPGFLAGKVGCEESIKFGVAGAIRHPQVDMEKVNYSREPWAMQPTQMIAYASCHDDMMLTDRLRSCVVPEKGKGVIKDDELKRLDKLAQTIVLTSQGIPFIWCGEEVMRDKKGVHNSYCSPDSINAIDWSLKAKNIDLFNYYAGLIALRKAHPAFRLGDAELVCKHLQFLDAEDLVVAYRIKDNAGGDEWNDIVVICNANRHPITMNLPTNERYKAVVENGVVDYQTLPEYQETVTVAPQSATILKR